MDSDHAVALLNLPWLIGSSITYRVNSKFHPLHWGLSLISPRALLSFLSTTLGVGPCEWVLCPLNPLCGGPAGEPLLSLLATLNGPSSREPALIYPA